ncbi:unnamed protein product, partial [Somion occarium]
ERPFTTKHTRYNGNESVTILFELKEGFLRRTVSSENDGLSGVPGVFQKYILGNLEIWLLSIDLFFSYSYDQWCSQNKMANMKVSILVINPNSSDSMTCALKNLLSDLLHPNLSLDFYTAPPQAPPSIDDRETSDISASITMQSMLPFLDPSYTNPEDADYHHPYTAYLIACYSPHPLTNMLRERTSAPVLNIFEASLLHARALALPFGIVTTGRYWEPVLSKATRDYFSQSNPEYDLGNARDFVGVRSTNLTAIQLHTAPKAEVDQRIIYASADLVREGARVIILGCAAMSGMEATVRLGAQNEGQNVRIIDGVRAGIVLLEGLIRARHD